jgi:hypothetical protein
MHGNDSVARYGGLGIFRGCVREPPRKILVSLSRWERVGVRAYRSVDPN